MGVPDLQEGHHDRTHSLQGEMMQSREECKNYWLHPERYNRPKRYLKGAGRTKFLTELVLRYAWASDPVLELGCNAGRNLDALHRAGFVHLSAIELNPEATDTLRRRFPGMAADLRLFNAPIEDIIKGFGTHEFALTFTLAVLEHIHPDSEFIFDEMTRISKTIITVEDEVRNSSRHCQRNYRHVFESRGMRQIEELSCAEVEGLGPDYVARVFEHEVAHNSKKGDKNVKD